MGVVAETGPDKTNGIIDEFSFCMIKSLGFSTDGATYVSSEEKVTTYIFTDTKKIEAEWRTIANQSKSSFSRTAQDIGREYYY